MFEVRYYAIFTLVSERLLYFRYHFKFCKTWRQKDKEKR